jgi:hypothetical protein
MELNDSWSTSLPWRSVVLLLGQLGHHDLADFVTGLAPDVHHLVVALAGGHQTRDVLLLDLLDFLLGALDQAGFSLGTSMSSMAIEMPARVASGSRFAAACRQRPRFPSGRTCGRSVDQREISFFFSALLMLENGRPLGRISDSSARPTVVSTSLVSA